MILKKYFLIFEQIKFIIVLNYPLYNIIKIIILSFRNVYFILNKTNTKIQKHVMINIIKIWKFQDVNSFTNGIQVINRLISYWN